jgi:hypothetical protein
MSSYRACSASGVQGGCVQVASGLRLSGVG